LDEYCWIHLSEVIYRKAKKPGKFFYGLAGLVDVSLLLGKQIEKVIFKSEHKKNDKKKTTC